MEEAYHRSSHHGEDFKRCDLMFTPVVNSIMLTCATEESGKRIKAMKLKSNPPKPAAEDAHAPIPFTDLESEVRRLKQKRCEVNHSDKKNHRTNAIPSKATYELKQLLEKSSEDGNGNTPTEILLGLPNKPSPRPLSSSGTTKKSPHSPRGSHVTKPSSVESSPRPRRPQTSQPSRYLASTRKVQFPQEGEGKGEAGPPANPPDGKPESSSPRKKPLKRDESRGIDDSMLQQSDDSSDDGNDVFDTFNMKGIYRLKKRRALLGASSDRQEPIVKPPQRQFRRGQTFIRPGAGEGNAAQPVPQYTIPPSVPLSEKEAYSAKIATQFLSNFLKKKPIPSALPTDPNQLADPGFLVDCGDPDYSPEEEIQPELLLHLFPTDQRNNSDGDRENKKQISSHPHQPQSHTRSKTGKKPVHLLPPPPSLMKSFRRHEKVRKVAQNQPEVNDSSVLPHREDPKLWLQKRMKALLAEYQAGEKKSGGLAPAVDEETRKMFEARTISIEISLLFRGFQTIGSSSSPPLLLSYPDCLLSVDKSNDGFLSCRDILSFCNASSSGTSANILSKSEIENALWLMDDHRYFPLLLSPLSPSPGEDTSRLTTSSTSICERGKSSWRAQRITNSASPSLRRNSSK